MPMENYLKACGGAILLLVSGHVRDPERRMTQFDEIATSE